MSFRKSWSASVEISRDLGARASTSLGSLVHDLDVQLLERRVELVQLAGLEIELAERQRDLVVREEAGFLPLPDERFRLFVLEHHGRLSPIRSSLTAGPRLF